jgi:ribosomal protein S18 acetylase RimI-like enzyme
MIEYRAGFPVADFLALAGRIWPREYDALAAQQALTRTTNLGAWDGARLVGAVRVLTDGYFFATIPEILVDPDYQRQGIGRALMREALRMAPRGKVFLGAQPPAVGFFERLGCVRGPVGFVATRSDDSLGHERAT